MSSLMVAIVHIPALRGEVLQALQVRPGGRYVDCTLGAGGHAAAILQQALGVKLLGIDADPEALSIASSHLAPQDTILVHGNFASLKLICSLHDFAPVDGILFDLGLSSMQLSESGRGFSFQYDAPLDMRFDSQQELTADQIVNTYTERELAQILLKYGEEPHSRQIARAIVSHRPIHTTGELAGVVSQAAGGRKGRLHPATRTFQALRIAVNRELDNLAIALRQAVGLLHAGGRLAVISYHSLEDRLVKEFLRQESRGCLCPSGTPVCVCDHQPTLSLVTGKVVRPSPQEVAANPRSRSAKLRAAEKL